jgi:hypothetical protein
MPPRVKHISFEFELDGRNTRWSFTFYFIGGIMID